MIKFFRITPEEYMLLVEQAPIMIWRSDTTAKCDYFNERWLAFTGRTMQKELGDGWAEGVHPEDFDRCIKIYTESFQKRVPFEMEYRLRRKDGEYRWLFDRGVPFDDEKGRFAGYIGSCIDITDQIKAREIVSAAKDREINNLRDLLPICANCKKIRNDSGYWEEVDSYFQTHKKTKFTHGICPDCLKTVTKQFKKMKK